MYKKSIKILIFLTIIILVILAKQTNVYAANRNLGNATITLSNSSYYYKGGQCKPTVTVKLNGSTVNSTNYTVTYKNNINAGNIGSASVTIQARSSSTYFGSKTKSFTINKRDISNCSISLPDTKYIYNGNEKRPKVTVKVGNNTISLDNYTVSYENNINAGTGKVTITGANNLKGKVTKTFTINNKNISKCSISLPDTKYIYNGNEKRPKVTVKVGKNTISVDNYTVSYENNINAGTGKVTIVGKNNLSGTVTKTFTINKKNISKCSISLSATEYTYNGKAKSPKVAIQNGQITLNKGTDYTVSYSDNIDAGTAKVTIKAKEPNYKGSITEKFKINPAQLLGCITELEQESYNYNGTAIEPQVKVIYKNKELKQNEDYTVKYSNNIDVGEATVTILGRKNYTRSCTAKFNITPLPIKSIKCECVGNWLLEDIYPLFSLNDKKLQVGRDYTIVKTYYNYWFLKTDGVGSVNFKCEYTIRGLNNFKDEYKFTVKKGGRNIVSLNAHMISSSSEWNYDFINKKLEGRLDPYLVDVNDKHIEISYFESPSNEIPIQLRYYNPYDDVKYYLSPRTEFTYTHKGNKWIIKGIGQYCGTRVIEY